MILVIDNYDSFVFNLDRYLKRLGQETTVVRNDKIRADQIDVNRYKAIVLSPGPQSPTEAGCCVEVVQKLGSKIPILGVCLGHQAIAQAYGADVVRAMSPIHGQSSRIDHCCTDLFHGIASPMLVGRYHSLVVEPSNLPDELIVLATLAGETFPASARSVIMAIRHKIFPVWGVQFHPESILTRGGYAILANFLRMAKIPLVDKVPGDELVAGNAI